MLHTQLFSMFLVCTGYRMAAEAARGALEAAVRDNRDDLGIG